MSPHYGSKPRLAVNVQDNRFDVINSFTVCVFTTDETDASLFHLSVTPKDRNGIRSVSKLIVDKLVTDSEERLGEPIGCFGDEDIVLLHGQFSCFSD